MYRILEKMPELKPWEEDIVLRMDHYKEKKKQILKSREKLIDFANAHQWYGFHRTADGGWVYREWAPAAEAVYLMGDFNGWEKEGCPLARIGESEDWEVSLPADVLHQGSRVKAVVRSSGILSEHMPLYTRRAVQDEKTTVWCCEVWDPEPYPWTDAGFEARGPLLIYEAHVGMAQEEERIGTYREFADRILPRIRDAGYNTVQLMAIQEHPYYGSFGYQVSNFFAASSWFGLPEDLKYLVNRAHEMGLRVLMDLVHSHAVKNTQEGINQFDGTTEQFFHAGGRGEHEAWGTKCFDYGKPQVLHFLLSNLKFWMEEFHFDGFRFDGVTSMLYLHHGLGVDFNSLGSYFSMATDIDAVTYLQLANELIRQVNPRAVTIAEDMSGMPGMCEKVRNGGIGFDYRLGMGLPDMWIRLLKEVPDEYWNLGNIWHQMTFRNAGTIAYVESHDQALVGDKTTIFRMADAAMYTDMAKGIHNFNIDRATALHKLLRLLTLGAGGNGYLNFMGNEFGHPEWIDFPREGNGWSFFYCRRQWSLRDNQDLKYSYLAEFDRDMIETAKANRIFSKPYPDLLRIHEDDHVLAFHRGGLVFIFNFHPTRSVEDYVVPVPKSGDWEVVFTSDDFKYGGFGRIPWGRRSSFVPGVEGNNIMVGLPPRTAMVLKKAPAKKRKIKADSE